MAIDAKLRKKLEGILAHVKRGANQGEIDNAARLLNKLLKKHGLTLADIDSEQTEQIRFKYKNRWEKRLLQQLHSKVVNHTRFVHYQEPNCKEIYFDLTQIQAIEMRRLYEFLRVKLAEELELAYQGLINAYDIFGASPKITKDTAEPDHDMARRILQRAAMIDGELPYLQIGE